MSGKDLSSGSAFKMKRSVALRSAALALVLGAGLVWGVIATVPDSKVHVVACNVGQGDAILVAQKSNQVLIDGGPNEKVVECLSRHLPFWDKRIELLVLTHPQADHLTGLIHVLRSYEVSQIVVSGDVNNTDGFSVFLEEVMVEDAPLHLAVLGDQIRVGNLVFEVLWPDRRTELAEVWNSLPDREVLGASLDSGDLNERSVVLLLKYEQFDALFAGDIGFQTEQALKGYGVLSDLELLKVSHHGSKYSTSLAFLEEILPELAVISVSAKNRFGHPTDETLERLQRVGSQVLRTDELGDVEVVSNGKSYWIVD